ncbi:MAG: hypothetical protein NTW29_16625 [Bacteroidetes bacterium]|nr:hypothetical protein [Bacteroidota bacterium]
MKLTTLFALLITFVFHTPVKAQKNYIKQLEVKENRFFYKPIANRYIRSSEIDFDNSAYMDVRFEGDTVIVADVFALNEDEGGWVKSSSVHGTDFSVNHRYVKLQNDVYIVAEALGEGEINMNVRDKPPFILYSKDKGVYYHSYSSDNNSGWGAYTNSKDKRAAKPSGYDLLQACDALIQKEVDAYNSDVAKRMIKKILAKKDQGFTSDWHKANAGKLLFGNALTNTNINTAASYKTKFTIDEPIRMAIFSDKGFNKYADATESDPEKVENLNGSRESTFKINLTLSNGVTLSRHVYIQHPNETFLTLYIHDLVFGKGKSTTAESNKWIKEKAKLDGLNQEVQVKAELVTTGGSPYTVAEGSFSFIPKAGAVMPYGYSCSPEVDIKIDNLAKIKPLLLANFKKALAAKPETNKFKVTEFSIRSHWQESAEVPFPFIEVNFVVKNEKGECLSGADKYLWFEQKKPVEQAGYFLRAESKLGGLVENLYPYCDCGN